MLTYRARVKLSGQFPVQNKITFFVPRPYAKDNMIDLLKSCRVNVVSLKYNNTKRIDYYKEAIRSIL